MKYESMTAPGPAPVGSAWDSAFEALRSVKDLSAKPHEHSQKLRDVCREMQEGIRRMLEYGPISKGGDDLRKINERLDRVVELANMQECGSLMIEIQRAMESAYRRMP